MLARINVNVLLALLAVACLAPAAQADLSATFDLTVFDSPEPVGPELNYTVTVSDTDVEAGQVRFSIANESTGLDSVLTSIYFDDSTTDGALAIAEVQDQTGPGISVDFTEDAINSVSPPELPAADLIGFETTVYLGSKLAVDSENPGILWGLNDGEYVDIVFDLVGGESVADIIALVTDRTIRIGAHIQSIGENEFSASAVAPIPAPGAGVLAAIGLMTAGYVQKRRQAKADKAEADQAGDDETPE